jgi:20S proteasome, alpha and beta subunits
MQVKNNGIYITGTTTVGITYKEGIILGADRRVSDAYNKKVAHKTGKKILQIDDHIVATIAGSVADAQFLIDQLRANAKLYKYYNNRPISVKSIANLASIILFNSRLFPYITEINIGGYDRYGPSLYTVDLLGSLTKEKYIARGSGSPYAMGLIEARYKPELELNEGIIIVVEALKSSISWDLFTGEGIDIAIVDKKGMRFLTEEEINYYISKVETEKR